LRRRTFETAFAAPGPRRDRLLDVRPQRGHAEHGEHGDQHDEPDQQQPRRVGIAGPKRRHGESAASEGSRSDPEQQDRVTTRAPAHG